MSHHENRQILVFFSLKFERVSGRKMQGLKLASMRFISAHFMHLVNQNPIISGGLKRSTLVEQNFSIPLSKMMDQFSWCTSSIGF